MFKIFVATLFVASLMSGPTSGWCRTADDPQTAATFEQLQLFADILARVNAHGVKPFEPKALIESAIDGMLDAVDEKTSFMPADKFRELQSSAGQNRFGVGLTTKRFEGAFKVVSVEAGGSAAAAGVHPGDYILTVNGEDTLGKKDLHNILTGDAGVVEVSVLRDSQKINFILEKREEQAFAFRTIGSVGYIRIGEVIQGTGKSLNRAIKELREQKTAALVLDLRDCPGGLFDEVIGVADHFLDGGVVASAKGKSSGDIERYNAKSGDDLSGLPIVVLINQGTAAGAEVVAAALKDNGRAKLVGTTSFGQGSLQTVIPLDGGKKGALRLTTAYLYTPSGQGIDKVGVNPDIEVVDQQNGPSDIQLDRALQVLKSPRP